MTFIEGLDFDGPPLRVEARDLYLHGPRLMHDMGRLIDFDPSCDLVIVTPPCGDVSLLDGSLFMGIPVVVANVPMPIVALLPRRSR